VVETGENQIININFSDPLKKGQNFKGLVVLEGDGNPKYNVIGNTLKNISFQRGKCYSSARGF